MDEDSAGGMVKGGSESACPSLAHGDWRAWLDGAMARDDIILFRLLLVFLVAGRRTSRSRTPMAWIWSVVVLATPSPLCPWPCHVTAPLLTAGRPWSHRLLRAQAAHAKWHGCREMRRGQQQLPSLSALSVPSYLFFLAHEATMKSKTYFEAQSIVLLKIVGRLFSGLEKSRTLRS
ncbi:hypothetical protein U9M48_022745 [Paspalum notatum var. saurae]|uniref:Uncharacterized protein n=1 Tax=Paspalum notatum var. saurae TaxID=547442 RepID=A0AAQ3TJ48_PASNO